MDQCKSLLGREGQFRTGQELRERGNMKQGAGMELSRGAGSWEQGKREELFGAADHEM